MRKLRDNAKGTLWTECNSINEMIDAAVQWGQEPQAGPTAFDRGEFIGHDGLGGGWKDFSRVFNQPWQKGMNLLAEVQRKVRDLDLPTPTQRKRRRGFNETSGDVDVDRVMRGEYACFSDPMRRDVSAPAVLRLMVPIGINCGDDAADVAHTSAAVAAVVDLLENSGRLVEIFMSNGTYNPWDGGPLKKFCFVSTIKNAADPLNLATLVNVFSPWFDRTVGWAMSDSERDLRAAGGRGRAAHAGDPLYAECYAALGIPENTDMVNVPRIMNMAACEKFIREIVARIQAG